MPIRVVFKACFQHGESLWLGGSPAETKKQINNSITSTQEKEEIILESCLREFHFQLKTLDTSYQLLNWLTGCLMQRDVELNSALGSRKSQCGPGGEIN